MEKKWDIVSTVPLRNSQTFFQAIRDQTWWNRLSFRWKPSILSSHPRGCLVFFSFMPNGCGRVWNILQSPALLGTIRASVTPSRDSLQQDTLCWPSVHVCGSWLVTEHLGSHWHTRHNVFTLLMHWDPQWLRLGTWKCGLGSDTS